MVHVSGFYEDQIMKKTQEQGSLIREQQPPAAQVNTKVSDKQPVPSKEGASSKERLHTDSLFDSSITTTPFSVSIPMSAGSQKGVRDCAPGPFYECDVGPNPREWVESCCCLSKWRFD